LLLGINNVFKKIIRYNLVQVTAYAIDMGTFLAIVSFLPERLVAANFCGKVFAGVYAFILHKYFTFGSVVEGGGNGEALRFTLLLIFNSVLSTLLLLFLSSYLLDTAAKFIADVICVGLSFFLADKLVFNVQERKS